MSEHCDFCGREALEHIYTPSHSARGLSVWLCTHCGLVQSLPRIDQVESRQRAVSAGADWGNVRYGKGFRAADALRSLARHADLEGPLRVLDVGANRGAFLRALSATGSAASVVAIEPDAAVVEDIPKGPGVELVSRRIEETKFASASFDIVHSCHTIEHLRSPQATLRDHWRVLKAGGLLYAEVPNIELIRSPDLVEEWFIDKHLFHYSPRIFCRQIEAAGFTILERPEPRDMQNIALVARKATMVREPLRSDPREVEAMQDLIAVYKANRARGRQALDRVARRMEELAPRGLAVWGAGRLFDALVSDAGFDARRPIAVVDSHLCRYGHCIAGRPVETPAVLAERHPGVIVVMSRAFAEEIRTEAHRLAPGAEILGYGELFSAALAER